MDIDKLSQMTFSNFIDRCAPFHKNEWTIINFNHFHNNCHHFIIKALKILNPKFFPDMIKLGNCSNPKEKKINIFPEVILKVLITYQIKISDLKK